MEEGKDDLDEDFDADQDNEENSQEEEFDISEYLQDDDTPDYKLSISNKGSDTEETDIPIGSGITFRDLLLDQLGLKKITEHQKSLAEHLIGNLTIQLFEKRNICNCK